MVHFSPPSSWMVSWKRRLIVTIAIVLDIAAAATIVVVHRRDILIASDPSGRTKAFQRILPALGAIAGTFVAAVNAWAISILVTAYARTAIITDGVTFAHIDHLYTLANARIPLSFSPVILLATMIALAEGLLPSAIVSCLTPTATEWSAQLSVPVADFSIASGATPDILCEYFQTRFNADAAGRVYGINCPLDEKFGDLYNIGLSSLWNEVPANSTRNGVSYPSDLLGISGAISSITTDFVKQLSVDANRAIIASDLVETCLPRMVVEADCRKSLPEGEYFNLTWHVVEDNTPAQSIIQIDHCFNATNTCDDPRYAPFFGNGVSVIFWNMDPTSGNTTLSLYNFASYKDVWGTDAVQCKVSAREEIVPVRVRGGASAEHYPALACPTGRPPPSPRFLLNVTRLADMTLIKLQGPDGNIAPAVAIPPGRDRVSALSVALQNIAAMGATEMYAKIYENSSLTAQWAAHVPLNYVTTRTRLGSSTEQSFAFILCPLVLGIVVVVGWCFVARRAEPNVAFNPLHPASAMAAGMNRQDLSIIVRDHDAADEATLGALPVILRFRPVTDERWGIDTRATHPDSLTNHRRNRGSRTYLRLDSLPSPSWLFESPTDNAQTGYKPDMYK